MLRLVPAYTLKTLNEEDIEVLLPFYFWNYRKTMGEKHINGDEDENNADIVEIGGKYYKRTNAKNSKLLDNIFS